MGGLDQLRLNVSMPEFRYDWFTGNIAGLTTLLERFKGKEHVRALEVGCFEGRSTIWFVENILTGPGSRIVCIDHFEGSEDHKHFNVDVTGTEELFIRNISQADYWGRVTLLKDHSVNVLRKIHKNDFDFVYLDGDHRSQGVLEDAVLSWRLLKPGGILIFDDYLWNNMPDPLDNPGPGIDAFLAVYKGKFKELMRGYQVAIEKL
jgi:predicted O-methyltransferase YrrM